MSVLVGEDDSDQRLALAAWLRLHGYRVALAENGCEALDVLLRAETAPSLILLDLAMPEVDGWRVLAYLARDPVLRAAPVIVTSGTLQGQPRIECPTVAFAPQPLQPDSLEDLIATLLASHVAHCPVPVSISDDEPTWPHRVRWTGTGHVPSAQRPRAGLPPRLPR